MDIGYYRINIPHSARKCIIILRHRHIIATYVCKHSRIISPRRDVPKLMLSLKISLGRSVAGSLNNSNYITILMQI